MPFLRSLTPAPSFAFPLRMINPSKEVGVLKLLSCVITRYSEHPSSIVAFSLIKGMPDTFKLSFSLPVSTLPMTQTPSFKKKPPSNLPGPTNIVSPELASSMARLRLSIAFSHESPFLFPLPS